MCIECNRIMHSIRGHSIEFCANEPLIGNNHGYQRQMFNLNSIVMCLISIIGKVCLPFWKPHSIRHHTDTTLILHEMMIFIEMFLKMVNLLGLIQTTTNASFIRTIVELFDDPDASYWYKWEINNLFCFTCIFDLDGCCYCYFCCKPIKFMWLWHLFIC